VNLSRAVAAPLVGAVLVGAALASGAVRATASPTSSATSPAAACRSSVDPALAARIAAGIDAAVRRRVSDVAVAVSDPGAGLQCWLNSSAHFDSASVIKATILGALLRRAQDRHEPLTRAQESLATAMITRSDNDAASALWDEVGRDYLQHFLNLAGMTRTYLGPGPYWGLTQITAYDETLLLHLLLTKNTVLDTSSRDYELGLMARVIPSQRWGVTAGVPTRLTAHVKNGWLPLATHGWRINSIGGFTGRGGGYSIVVLTQDNPTMDYGITTVEAIATVVNRDLNPGVKSVTPAALVPASRQTPDETIPSSVSTP
jgi:Beta-lactamase enzyme family